MPRKKSKLPVTGGMRVNAYAVLVDAVERAVEGAWNKSHDETDHPSKETICEAMERRVIDNICEVFNFDDFYADVK
jgi:hypothetical protein